MLLASSASVQSVIINSPVKKLTVAIRNATIVSVSSATIPNGTIVFSNGVITAVGASAQIPANATVIDGTGLFVYPGLIDAGSHVGLEEISAVPGTVDTAELGDINPNARAEVAVNPHSNVIPVTRVNGITSVVTEPEGGIISGSSAMINLAGWTRRWRWRRGSLSMSTSCPCLRTSALDDRPPNKRGTTQGRNKHTKQMSKVICT